MNEIIEFIVYIRLQQESIQQAVQLLQAVIPLSRAEPGCLRFETYKTAAEPIYFVMQQHWKDRAALDHHMQQPHTIRFRSSLNDLGASLDTQILRPYDE